MMQHDNRLNGVPSPSAPLGSAEGGKSAFTILGAALLFVVLAGGGYLTLRGNGGVGGGTEESEAQPGNELAPDYTKWEKPLFALVLSGQMHGYIDPCGCSSPQYGGLPRRFNFVQSLKAKNWDVVGIDLGELPHLKGIREQNLLKYELTVKSLMAMNYRVLGIGRDEILGGLGEYLSQISNDKNPYPRPIILSLDEATPGQQFHKELNLRQYEIIDTTKPKIGIINMMGPDLREELKGRETFIPNKDELPKALQAFADAGVEFGIILHHEYPKLDPNQFPKGGIQRMLAVEKEREKQARFCAEYCDQARKDNPKIPPIQMMMVLMEDPEPPGLMKELGNPSSTRVVEIGHKGKYVGLVGVFAGKGGYRLQYQKVLMSPDWDKKGAEKDNVVITIMERYNQVLKQHDMLAKAPRSPQFNQLAPNGNGLKATYVGSNRCRTCHLEAFNVWKDTAHFKSTDTLEKQTFPSGRQYDPECMKCHTTGFEHPGGYYDLIPDLAAWAPGRKAVLQPGQLEDHNKKLRGVGCESCHGPGSEHVKIAGNRPPNKAEREAINPYRPTDEERKLEGIAKKDAAQQKRFAQLFGQRMEFLNRFCIQCHDSENDVNWGKPGKEVHDKWFGGKHPLIHRTAKDKDAGGGIAPGLPIRQEPAAKSVELPPIVIEVVDEKKK